MAAAVDGSVGHSGDEHPSASGPADAGGGLRSVRAVPAELWPEGASLDDGQVAALHAAAHKDPGFVLGLHAFPGGKYVVRAWHGALEVAATLRLGNGPDAVEVPMKRRCAWLFEAVLEGCSYEVLRRMRYSLLTETGGASMIVYDANAYPDALISDEELAALHAGFCPRIENVLGSHCTAIDGVWGLRFVVWAPRAQLVSVVGDFNGWDGRAHPMRRRLASGNGAFAGLWELFLPCGTKRMDVPLGSKYMFKVKGVDGVDRNKIDPFAQEFEAPPKYASVVSACDDSFSESPYKWGDAAWLAHRTALGEGDKLRRQAMAIYEVHLPSWRRSGDGEILNYRDVAPMLVEHMKAMHFNYLELLPLAQHPFPGSWGYQVTGHYAAYSSLGTPDDFKHFVDTMHQAGIGVIMDYVPAHFCKDDWALVNYDGSATFEYEDPREGEHSEWGTKAFNFKRNEVRAYLIGVPLFWIERYHVDGIRVDAVSAMLYRNFMRKEGEWITNELGGNSFLEAISLLREMNAKVKETWPGVIMCAEESTSWSGVTGSLDSPSGLGFDFKWDLGWMNDTLSYLSAPAMDRPGKHEKITFRGLYMQHERWVLPLSHDEVVSGKGSLVDKMSYLDFTDFYEKVRLLKALYGFQVGSPGRPLLFMGGEIAQGREWNYTRSIDWHEGEEELRSKLCTWVSDLLGVYCHHKPLHAGDDEPHGSEEVGLPRSFEWTEVDNREACVVAFVRHWAEEQPVLVVCNFSPRDYFNYALGVPFAGAWQVLLNSDDSRYGGKGGGPGNHGVLSTSTEGRFGWPACLWFDIPAHSCMMLLGPPKGQGSMDTA